MRKFVFSMQKVLDLRNFEKKQAEIDLGKSVAEETRIQNELEKIAKSRASNVAGADGVQDLKYLYGVNKYFLLLDKRKEELLYELSQVKIITEQKRDVMRECIKKCKVLENLKEMRLKEWKKQSLKLEDAQTDDIVTASYQRTAFEE